MSRPIDYFRRALALPRGWLMLLAQGALGVIALWIFVQSIPWMMSHDISKIGDYEDPSPKPPAWARAFSVNHGTFIYYADRRSDAPAKFWGIIAYFTGYGVVSRVWSKSIWRRGERVLQQRRIEQVTSSNGP